MSRSYGGRGGKGNPPGEAVAGWGRGGGASRGGESPSRGGGRRRGGASRGRGEGRAKRSRREQDPDKALSKVLSKILRHKASELGLRIRPDGYIALGELLSLKMMQGYGADLARVQQIVRTNDKQRFSLSEEEGIWWIRANQGHSISSVSSEQLLTPITDTSKYPLCYHGTDYKAWKLIKTSGLNRMRRKHIHFASKPFRSDQVISGSRVSSQVLIYIDLERAIKAGIPFYVSSNEVILTEGLNGVVPPQFFSRVVDAKTNNYLPLSLPTTKTSQLTQPSEDAKPAAYSPSSLSSRQAFHYLAVLDFEATCLENKKIHPQEIIEFPVQFFNTTTRAVDFTFHRYVRPVQHPHLSAFCTQLTGIEQATVDQAQPFPSVYDEFQQFLLQHKLLNNPHRTFAFVTCGDWDLKTMLPSQFALVASGKAKLPAHYRRWFNIKREFKSCMQHSAAAAQGSSKRGRRVSGMPDMLKQLNLPLVGRHHSGIDDVKNIGRIAMEMMSRYNFVFKWHDSVLLAPPATSSQATVAQASNQAGADKEGQPGLPPPPSYVQAMQQSNTRIAWAVAGGAGMAAEEKAEEVGSQAPQLSDRQKFASFENLCLNTASGCVFFWKPPHWGCQWTMSPFEVDGVQYNCTEQYMMAGKARLFGDDEMLKRILSEKNPRKQQQLGKLVGGFVQSVWASNCRSIVLQGNVAKFRQNPDLLRAILATGDKPLVEASPVDRIWGIGLAADKAVHTRPRAWRGTNYLGQVLMKTREILRATNALANNR